MLKLLFFIQMRIVIKCLAGCEGISPSVSLPVIQVEPDQAQLTLKLPQVGVGLSFTDQIPVSSLCTNHIQIKLKKQSLRNRCNAQKDRGCSR